MGQKKGFKHSEETKKIIGDASRRCWANPEYVKKFNEGRQATWDKRGYVNSPEARKKLSDIMKQKIAQGIIDVRKISPYVKGHKKGMTGKKHTNETKLKMGIKAKEHRKYQVFPKCDTKIEVKIQNFLKQLGISFFTHQYIDIEHGYQCDILIPSMNLIVECDGDYWHRYPIGMDIDKIRTSELIQKGFRVLRLWEHEIKIMSLEELKIKLGEYQHGM